MLDEPYRWVEAVRNRREYVEDQLQGASPVVAARYDGGVLMLTSTPGPRKLFEVYNEVAFAAVGHPADIEKLRKAVIDIAHVEAYNLSASDVSLHRLVSFGMGPLMKTAFDEIFRSPYLARVLVAELEPSNERETFYTIDADGSFQGAGDAAAVAGTATAAQAATAWLRSHEPDEGGLRGQLRRGLEAWGAARASAGAASEGEPDGETIASCVREAVAAQRLEAAVLDPSLPTKTKFRLLTEEELEPVLSPYRD
ncbi:proteasome subunit alpha [Candidatus Latescibacterota bacterium]